MRVQGMTFIAAERVVTQAKNDGYASASIYQFHGPRWYVVAYTRDGAIVRWYHPAEYHKP